VQALWRERMFPLSEQKPLLNLGAGTCKARESDLAPLLEDPNCIDFAKRVGGCAAVTTVRDALTAQLLAHVGCAHELLPCPAFLAARSVNGGQPVAPREILAVNLMELAGHFLLKPENDPRRWSDLILATLPKLRERFKLLFVAHDEAEVRFLRHCNYPHEMIFHSTDYRDYLSLYSRVAGVVANRVHAAVSVAGFGRPAVLIGNDSRIGVARPVGIPAIDASEATSDWIVDALDRQTRRRDELLRERTELRERTAKRYARLIRSALS
jgi:polysaccharide pyruvyl transferase WcaK-like protein